MSTRSPVVSVVGSGTPTPQQARIRARATLAAECLQSVNNAVRAKVPEAFKIDYIKTAAFELFVRELDVEGKR